MTTVKDAMVYESGGRAFKATFENPDVYSASGDTPQAALRALAAVLDRDEHV